MSAPLPKKSKRGGARPGAGRPRKSSEPTNFAAYEGAWRFNPQRAWIYTPTLDASKEFSQGTREELIRKAWWLVNNLGTAGGAVDKVARLVGPLIPQARTSDPDWNMMAEQSFHAAVSWAPGVDAGAAVNFYQAQTLLVRQMAIAGDVFWQRITSNSGRGMFRLIPGENVGSVLGDEKDGFRDGVLVNKYGRPLKYRVLKSPAAQLDYTDVSANDLTQVRKAYRLGHTRAPSWLARAANHLQDISEIVGYEKMSAKLGASMAFVIESPEAGQVGFGSQLVRGQSTSSASDITVDAMMNGSVIPQLKPGEKLTSFNNLHPSANFKSFIEFLQQDIAVGFGTSKQFLFDSTDAGGANQRWILVEAQAFIREIQDIIRHSFAEPFWKFWVWNEIEAGRLPMPGNGEDWFRVDFCPPADLSVDFSRDGRLLSDLMLRGQISPQRYFALQGLDADRQEEDIVRFAARRKKLVERIGKEEGVALTVSEVFPPAPGTPIASGAMYEGEPPEDEESEESEDADEKPSAASGRKKSA